MTEAIGTPRIWMTAISSTTQSNICTNDIRYCLAVESRLRLILRRPMPLRMALMINFPTMRTTIARMIFSL